MTPPNPDPDTLLGIFAVRLDLLSRDTLAAAVTARARAGNRSLGEILVEQGALPAEIREYLEALVEHHVALRGGEAARGLTAEDPAGATPVAPGGGAAPGVRYGSGRGPDTLTTRVEPPGAAAGPPAGPHPRFRIVRLLARGGIGEVFVAHDEELNRPVALKEMQARFAGSPDSRGRFLSEAEITGRLEHPGVVPVYGLGAYPDGRPFYAMRLVEGEDLRHAIERFHAADAGPGARLAFRELLGRFVAVCNAVAFAHSRGVLHRDLKPANVMLGRYGETLVVDWGLAKAAGPAAPAAAEAPPIVPRSGGDRDPTQHGSAVGTPAYMSPEQAGGRLAELGPASDVYGLGATLYTVLTGRPPVDGAPVSELLRRVQAGEVAPPRRVNPEAPAALDAVCRKAMALDPADRYPTALALAADVEAWLAGERVSAWKEPLAVRAGRWVRRHRVLVTGAAAAGLVGLVSLAVATALLAAANERERAAKGSARKRLGQVEKGYDVLATVFKNLDPSSEEKEGKPLRVLLGERLDTAAKELQGDAVGDPVTVAKLQDTLGKSLRRLGRPSDAVALLEKAAATLADELGDDHPDTLNTRADLASAYQDAGKLDVAIPLYERTLKGFEARLGENHNDTVDCREDLATAYQEAGKLGLAIPLLERTLKARSTSLGADHPDTYISRNNLAVAFLSDGQFERAIPLLERTVPFREAKLGADHPDTLVSRSNLAAAYLYTGKVDVAVPLYERNLKAFEAKLGGDHPNTLSARNNLGKAYREAGKFDLAIPLLERTLRDREAKLGVDHPASLKTRSYLADAYRAAGKLALAVPLLQVLVPRARAKLGAGHPDTGVYARQLVEALLADGQFDNAVGTGREFVAAERKHRPPDDPKLADALSALGRGLLGAGRPAEAEAPLREALSVREGKQPDDWTTFDTQSLLGAALLGQKKYADAEPLLRGGYEGLKQRETRIGASQKGRLAESLERLVQLSDARGDKDEADRWRKKLAEANAAARPKGTDPGK
jgi:serine/threonine-protein kinase